MSGKPRYGQGRSITIEYPASALTGFVAKPFIIGRDAHADANFSYQFASVNALLHGSIEPSHYDEAAVRSAEIAMLIARSSLAPLPAGLRGSRVTVERQDGGIETAHVPIALRHPLKHESSDEEIFLKFEKQAIAAGLSRSGTGALGQAIRDLHLQPDLRQVTRLLGPPR